MALADYQVWVLGEPRVSDVNLNVIWVLGEAWGVLAYVAGGWANISKINGIASSSISKVDGIVVANIAKINGVAV